MKLVRQPLLYTVSLVAVLALSACGKKEEAPAPAAAAPPAAAQPAPAPATPAAAPISVASVELGTGVDINQKITTPSSSFAPKDTIYASAATTGSGSAKLDAKWTYQSGQTVSEESNNITAPANTSFRISKPDGFPAGNYKVEISLNGSVAASKDFSVK
ncbi:hypothetical protein [Dyella silvatica]|uniref:hypothetical protein n=1 Tax=Dyella silvatica TaxID=2992128 RepID=UPI002256E472|nr:hypothetical protein [Dyella silvatica]